MITTISRASAILAAARTLAAKIVLAIPIDRAALTKAMTEATGGSDADGLWQQRDSFEALEVAIALTAPELTARSDGASAIRIMDSLSRELPTHTRPGNARLTGQECRACAQPVSSTIVTSTSARTDTDGTPQLGEAVGQTHGPNKPWADPLAWSGSSPWCWGR